MVLFKDKSVVCGENYIILLNMLSRQNANIYKW